MFRFTESQRRQFKDVTSQVWCSMHDSLLHDERLSNYPNLLGKRCLVADRRSRTMI